jgi:hypothetical protein
MNTARGAIQFGAQPEEGAPQHFHIMFESNVSSYTDLFLGDDYNYFKLVGDSRGASIGAYNQTDLVQHNWNFDENGLLTLPGAIRFSDNTEMTTAPVAQNLGDFVFDDNRIYTAAVGDVHLEAGVDLYLDAKDDDIFLRANDDVRIRTGYNFDDDTYQWQFRVNDDGTIEISNESGDFYTELSHYMNGAVKTTDLRVTEEFRIIRNQGEQFSFMPNGDFRIANGATIRNLGGDDLLAGGNVDLTGYATEQFVNTAVSNLVNSAPGTLDTLNELAMALGNNPNFATSIATRLGTIEGDITTLQQGSGGASVTISATAPTSPATGDLWYDETQVRTFVWNGSAWIDAAPAGSTVGLATEAYVNTAVANSINEIDGGNAYTAPAAETQIDGNGA